MSVRLIRKATAGDVVLVPNRTVNFNNPGSTAFVGYRLDADGQIYDREASADGAYSDTGDDWVRPASNAANYEVEAVLDSGTLSSGTTGAGTWQALTSDRTWTLSSNNSDESASITISIRRVGTSTVLDTATIALSADSSPL